MTWITPTKHLPASSYICYRQTMEDRREELERFKRIDLRQYAESRGFVVDRKASSRNSIVMRHANGDKIGIGKTTANTYVFFNYKNDQGGSIIDLVLSLDGGNLGTARKTLRAYDGSSQIQRAPSPPLPFELQPSQHDASRVLAAWIKAKTIGATGHPYLTEHRGISAAIQNEPAFHDRIRIDGRGNAVFPHFNQSGLCGFELKNGNASGTTFTGFSPGGVKGLACSRPRNTDREMAVCETAVDMLSLAAVEGTENRRFFSTSGQFSSHQVECLRSAVRNMPSGATRVLLAFDHDDGGRQLASQIRDVLQDCSMEIVDYFPAEQGMDWNDVLRQNLSTGGRRLTPT